METDETTKASTPSRGRRWALRLVKAFRVLIVVALGLFVLYTIADQITWRRVVAQRAEFAERFGVVSTGGTNPELPSPEEDAGRYYRYAWSLIAKGNDASGEVDPYTAMHDRKALAKALGMDQPPTPEAAEEYARQKLATAQPGLDVALEAATMKRGVLAPTNDSEVTLPTMTEARELARYLSARAEIAARDGDLDLALTYLHATLHLARTVGENRTLLAELVQISIVGIAFDSSQHVLELNGATGNVATGIVNETKDLRDPARFVRALTGEVLYEWDTLHGVMPRLWAGLNELRMSETLTAMANAVNAEDPTRRRELLAQAKETAEQGPYLLYVITQITAPALARAVAAWERVVAQTTLMEVGLAISQYHEAYGAYPETLDLVAAFLGGSVPSDPYTGASLVYERRGEGYLLYSAGPNLTDDGGTPLGGPGGMVGDVLWSIGQPEPEPKAEAKDGAFFPARRGELMEKRGIRRLLQKSSDE
jgi:hypothetical protein